MTKPAGEDSLRAASTFDLDKHVRKSALKLQDKPLLAKLSAGDLIAQDAQYHVRCLVSLYNKARATKKTVKDQDDINHDKALGELVLQRQCLHGCFCVTSVQTGRSN